MNYILHLKLNEDSHKDCFSFLPEERSLEKTVNQLLNRLPGVFRLSSIKLHNLETSEKWRGSLYVASLIQKFPEFAMTDLQYIDHQGQQVAEEEDRHHTEEHRGQPLLPSLAPPHQV